MIVHVSHPARIVRIPPRARNERREIVGCVTEVRLREADPAELVPLGLGLEATAAHGGWGGAGDLHLRDGTAWRPIGNADDLSAFLSSRSAGAGEFYRTPLVAIAKHPGGLGTWDERPTRGDVPAGAELGRIVRDGRPEAALGLARFLERDILLAGGIAYRRYQPIASFAPDGSCALVPWIAHPYVSPDHEARQGINLPMRADDLSAGLAAWGFRAPRPDRNLAAVLASLPASAYGDDDLSVCANAAADMVGSVVSRALSCKPEPSEGEIALLRGLAALKAEAVFGGIGEERVGPALAAMAEGLALASDRRGGLDPKNAARRFGEVMGRYGRARLAGGRDPEDDASIAGLAP